MRTAFIERLLEEARVNPRLFLVVGDLGFSVVEPFAREFPDRFLNAGVAEQNMTGVAAGLASEGYHVFTYSIANFPTLRCLEQIRNDVCYHRLPVTVVAVGAGLAYGNLGYSHHAVQDIAVMRTLPHLTLLSPADPGETHAAVSYLSRNPGPSYLRLGKAGEKSLHAAAAFGREPICVRSGDVPIALMATGSILQVALDAAARLQKEHRVCPAVFSCPWLAPCVPEDFRSLAPYSTWVSLEEHVLAGGLADVLRSVKPPSGPVIALGLGPEAGGIVGSQAFLRSKAGLDTENVVATVLRQLQAPPASPL